MAGYTLRYKYRAYPTSEQQALLSRHFGAARVVYNDFIALNSRLYKRDEQGQKQFMVGPLPKFVGVYDAQKKLITQAKTTSEREWLKDTPVSILQASIADAGIAYKNFFDSVKGKRKGSSVGTPKFKKRTNNQSIHFKRKDILNKGALQKINKREAFVALAGLGLKTDHTTTNGKLRIRYHRDLPSTPSSATLNLEADGKYYISFVVEKEITPLPISTKQVGIDMGLTHLATLAKLDEATGELKFEKIDNPRFLKKKQRKLARAQRDLSRKKKGSNNYAKARKKVAQVHSQVREARKDHHNKIVSKLVGENQTISIETLNIKGMAKTRLAKSVHDAGMSMFLTKLETKSNHLGRTVIKTGQWMPSSKKCSTCGLVGEKLPLSIRTWSCASCGSTHDRDSNAALNLLLAARSADSLNACGENYWKTNFPLSTKQESAERIFSAHIPKYYKTQDKNPGQKGITPWVCGRTRCRRCLFLTLP